MLLTTKEEQYLQYLKFRIYIYLGVVHPSDRRLSWEVILYARTRIVRLLVSLQPNPAVS